MRALMLLWLRKFNHLGRGMEVEEGKALTLRGHGEHVLILCAARYAMGRHTYMPSLVCDVIRAHSGELDPSTARLIARDIREEWLTWFGPSAPNAEARRDDMYYECDWGCFVSLLPELDRVALGDGPGGGSPELPIGFSAWGDVPDEVRWHGGCS